MNLSKTKKKYYYYFLYEVPSKLDEIQSKKDIFFICLILVGILSILILSLKSKGGGFFFA